MLIAFFSVGTVKGILISVFSQANLIRAPLLLIDSIEMVKFSLGSLTFLVLTVKPAATNDSSHGLGNPELLVLL